MAPIGRQTSSGFRKFIISTIIASAICITALLFRNQLMLVLSQPNLGGIVDDSSPPDTFKYAFREIPILEDLNSSDNKVWASTVLPAGGGFLYVQTENDGTAAETWGISMFHALHCLQRIREAMQVGKDHLTHGKGHGHLGEDHIGHCFGYIAQHLLCAADDTIEPPFYEHQDGDTIAKVNGVGYSHQCRDSNFLWNISIQSETKAFERWNWKAGDTVHRVFGGEARKGRLQMENL